jgi:predicted HTH domain antitoxin
MNNVLTVEYPDTLPDALNMSQAELEREARLAMSIKLFETGRLSSGQAAGLVGMARSQFLHEVHRFGVSAIQVEPDELEQDLAAAEGAHDRRRQ